MERFQQNSNQQVNNQNQNNDDDNNQNNQNNSNNQSNNNSNNDNNDDNNNNNVDNIKSIWDNNNNEEQNNEQNNNNQNVNLDPNAPNPAEVFDQHIAGLNLAEGIDLSNLQSEAAEGNFDAINKGFEQVAANTYKAALQSMNKLVDSKIDGAIEKAVSESSNVMNETTAIREMHSALPFAGDKDIAPVAEAAMKQFMSQGSSVNDAIQKVGQFFQTTSEKVTGMSSSANNPGSGGFNPNTNVNNSNNNSNQDEESWMDFLTNK